GAGDTERCPPGESPMGAVQLEGPRAAVSSLLPTREAHPSAAEALSETLDYLVRLQERLWQSARDAGASRASNALEAPGEAARRVRRARQAAAIQAALHVLVEL